MKDGKRTHQERLSALREVFGRRKELARSSGKKHDVSITKICNDADVDKTYLFGHRLQEGDKFRDAYLKLRDDILRFQKDLEKGLEKTEDRKAAEDWEKKYNALLCSVGPLQQERVYLKAQSTIDMEEADRKRDRETELHAMVVKLKNDLANTPKVTNLAGGFADRIQANVVSPDAFRVVGGKYRIGSLKQEEAAWAAAYQKLEELLSRKLKMRLYVLVGLPCSGKSTWAQVATLRMDRHPVIWDATNLTSVDRHRLVATLGRFKDLPKTCVYFQTDMEVIRERNRTLRTADKRMSDDELTRMRDNLQKPDPYEEDWIEELMVVRYPHG